MTENELVKGLTYLGIAYNKEFTKQECSIHYDFLKEYNYETFVNAIKNIIKTSKFLPKITDLIEACENAKSKVKFDVIEYMRKVGYFKDLKEYEKATYFMEKNIVPDWLRDDINKYYKLMLNSRIETKEQQLIG